MNSEFKVSDLELEGLKLITPFYVEDKRGFFMKNLERDVYASWGLHTDIYEEFQSCSQKDVIRGMHFQIKNPQIKIVQVITGTVRDIVVDLRKDSNTFGRYVSIILSEENHNILWIPKGFAHGFEVLSEKAIMSYQCIGKFLKEYDMGICWNDPTLNISWRTKNPIVSDKDMALMTFQQFVADYQGL